jgi:DNA-binding LacI/PurR family transcriptional regulator/DNA-binding transcriptional regulator YhcF (GntR family)
MVAREHTKYRNIVQALRDGIVSGTYAPGYRLPTRTEIGTEFGVGVATVQRALDELIQDGFVYARARAGTFVAVKPPHLTQYGLLMRKEGLWSLFFTAIRKAMGMIRPKSDICFHEYLTSRDVTDRRDVERLSRDVVGHRLGGIIFVDSPADLVGTPVLQELNMPRVMIQPRSEFGIPSVVPDQTAFVDRALEYLASRGCRRIAHLLLDFPYLDLLEWGSVVRARGLEYRPYWMVPVAWSPSLRSASYGIQTLMNLEGDKRPDGLIIHDDNLTQHAVAGLLAAGVRVPEDLQVVTSCNFPLAPSSALPLTHLGFDSRVVLERCLESLEMQRRGETPLPVTRIQPVFENELAG